MPQHYERPPWCKHSLRDYPSFHICLDLSQPEPAQQEVKAAGGAGWNRGMTMSEEHKERIREGQKRRWSLYKSGKVA